MKREEFGRSSVIIIVFLILSISLIFFSQGEEKISLIFIPIIYIMLFIVFAKIHRYINYPGMFVLNVISGIRYLLLPILIIIYPNYIDMCGSLSQGIKFMIFEELCLGFFMIFITKKYYKNKTVDNFIGTNNKKNVLLKLITAYAVIIVIINPNILSTYNFVFVNSTNLELIKKRSLITGIDGMIVDWGKLFLPLLIAIPFIKKYRITKNNIYYLLVITIILAFNVMIFSGTSRNSVIMPAVASMFFLYRVFPNKSKRIFGLMSLIIVIVALQLTLLKTEYLGTRVQSSLGSTIDYLEAYFGGPKNMGISITAKETYAHVFTMKTLLNDLFGNFPGLVQFFNFENRTTTFYNLIYYNGGPQRDQIIPSMGQGLFYFGYIFSFIPQMLIVFIMAKFDSLYRTTKDLISLFFISYFAVRFGFTYVQNISIILSFLYSTVIPISIILLIDEKINYVLKGRRERMNAKSKDFICNK